MDANDKINVLVVTTNFNSDSYMDLAKLSLYSIFRSLESLPYRSTVLLIDSASTDGSFEKLLVFGRELAEKKRIGFLYERLTKDLGNSYALMIGFNRARKIGARCVLVVDNDFVLLDPYLIHLMISVLSLNTRDAKICSVGSFFIEADRSTLSTLLSGSPRSLEEIEHAYDSLMRAVKEGLPLRDSYLIMNLAYVDMLGRIVQAPSRLPYRVYLKLVERPAGVRLFITVYNPSTCTLYSVQCAPFNPYLYIIGDDALMGVEHTKRGLYNVVLTKVSGIHFALTSSKASPKRIYLETRNGILISSPLGAGRLLLFYVITGLYLLMYIAASLLSLRDLWKTTRRDKFIDPVQLGSGRSTLLRYRIAGFVHGLLRYRLFSKRKKSWFDTYTGVYENRFSLLTLLIRPEDWSRGGLGLTDLVKYILSPQRMTDIHRDVLLVARRVRKRRVVD